MWKAFKNMWILLLVLIVSTGIYWLVYMDKESKGDALEYALLLLGNDLMAKVPDTPEKNTKYHTSHPTTIDPNNDKKNSFFAEDEKRRIEFSKDCQGTSSFTKRKDLIEEEARRA